MGKISQVSSKYIIHASIEIDGVVDRPDVIGAIFGQTEGLIGSELELRELQRSGRIGRIEVNVDTKGGKTQGSIIIPSSLDKAETSIIAASMEIIQRIGPCNARVKVTKIEDVRISKRKFVVERAKELLKQMMDGVIPDSQELADEVAYSVRVMEITSFGTDRLPAGPAIDDSDEVIVVEGRADVVNLLKHGFKNAIAINGTSIPLSIIELSKKKEMILFVDGDRGGKLIIKEILSVAEIDFVTIAPDGKEVEEITKKEIHKCLRSKVASEQIKMELSTSKTNGSDYRTNNVARRINQKVSAPVPQRIPPRIRSIAPAPRRTIVSPKEKEKFKELLEDLIGTKGVYILDNTLNILGKVPLSEFSATISSLSSGVYAVVFDGVIDKLITQTAEKSNIKYLVAMDSTVKQTETRVNIITGKDL